MLGELFKKAQENVFLPLVRRIASNVGTAAATFGVTQSQIDVLEAAVVVLGGMGIDLILSRFNSTHSVQKWGRN